MRQKTSVTLANVEGLRCFKFPAFTRTSLARTTLALLLTQRDVLRLQHPAAVDVRPGHHQQMMRGAGFDVTKTQQLVILWTEMMKQQ